MSIGQCLEGKVAIVTGGARNMGRAFCDALARLGADVVVHHHSERSAAQAQEAAASVRSQGRRSLVVCGDLSVPRTVGELFAATRAAFSHVDVVVNNAGVVIKKPMVEVSEADFDRSFGANAKAAFFVMQEAARQLRDGGRIINMGTTILGATIPFYSVYAGAKAPLEAFTRALAKEIGARGITVNVVAPGPIDTPFYHGAETPESVARATTASVAGRLGRVEDIVPLIEFLASPQSQWVTAQTLFINGGYLAR
jgi:NAD(P)-dependent dehydrogenase (short-subunit alcohol dehydrogenase family)